MEFDIGIERTTYTKVRLVDKEIRSVVSKFINRKYNIYHDDWIKDGKLMRSVEYHVSHSWFEDEVVRTALEFDSFLLDLLKEIK